MKDGRGIDRDRISPDFLQRMSEPLESVFMCIQNDLTVMLGKALGEGTLRMPASQWRSAMLAKTGKLTRGIYSRIAAYAGDTSDAVVYAVRSAVIAGIEACEPELARSVRAGTYVPAKDATIQRVADAYAAQALESCNMVNTVMLNSTLKAYREIIDDVSEIESRLATDQEILNAETGAVIVGAKSRQEAVASALRAMARSGITGFIDKRGRQWSADAYVNMDIRTTAAAAARQAAFQRNEDYGNHLISVSSHAGARQKCYPYQGKVYSTDGTSGVVKDLNGKKEAYIPLSSTSYGDPGGLFGINCGHFNYPFIPGISVVRADVQPKDENDAQYKLKQQQRAYERRIRALKTEADALEAAGLTAGAKEARRQARVKAAELRDWCADNKQDYKPDRLRVTRVENGGC